MMHGTATAAAPAIQLDRDNPWPGLDSFEENAHGYFNGRREETDELLRRVADASLTVLFSKSGLGKTSLLQAGLFPRLREKHFLPVHVRLDIRPEAPGLSEQLRDRLLAEIERERVDAPPFADGETLWEYLHRADLELWSEQNYLLTPVLVLDQFEEVFTLGERLAGSMERFKIDLGDLAENRIPAALARRLTADASMAQRLDLRRMDYKLIVALREDFLPHLEGWRATVPSLGRVRLRLLPMRPDQALSAVYDTAPHLMDEPLARRIVAFVAAAQSDGGAQETSANRLEGEIEPALLSLFCRGLNEQRKRLGKDRFDEQLLEGAQQSIIADHYRSCVEGLPDSVSRFIETDLITEKGFRNSHAKDDAVPGLLTQEQLDRLINRRLLRLEERYGTARIELTHDLLTRAVMAHRGRRRLEEEKAALEAQARAQRRRVVALALIALVCLAFAGIAAWQWGKALDAQRSALSAKLVSDSRVERGRALDLSFLLGAAAWSTKPTLEVRSILLSNLLEQLVGILPLRSDFINGVVFSPDGRTLAVPEGTKVILWDVARHARLGQPLGGHKKRVSNIAFSPDGKTLATVGLLDGTVFLWDVASHTELGRLPVGANWSIRMAMAFSPNGKILATDVDGTIILWDVGSRKPLGKLAGHTQGVQSLAFSPNGKILASGGEDHIVILWDVQSRKPFGKRLVWGSDAACSAPLLERRFVVSWCSITSVAFSPDGHTLASGTAAGTVVLWNVESRTIIGEPLFKHEKPVDSVAFSRNGGTLVSGSDDAIILWDVPRRKPEGNPLFAPRGVNLSSVVLGPDGKILAAGIARQTIMLWDLAGRILGEPLVGLSSIRSVAFSPDSRTLATVSGEMTESGEITEKVILWDVARRKPLAGPLPHSSAVAFSPDGKTFATGSQDGTIILRDVARRKPGEPLPKGKGELWSGVSRMLFSPDGQILAVERDEGIQLWDIARRTPLKVHIGGSRGSFSPDGTILATMYGPVTLWNVENGFFEPWGEEAPDALNIAFSPDGRVLASGSRLWDVAHRAQIGEGFAKNDRDDFRSVAFSPDGRILASGGKRGIVRFWDVARRAPLRESLNGFQEEIYHVCFSPDGKTLASVGRGGNGSVILWDVDPDSWSRRACFIAGRNLNCNEWRHYLLDEPYRKICPGLPGPERCN